MFSVGNIGDRESCHDGLGFALWKELAQFFKRGARQRLKRTEMTQQGVSNRIFADQESQMLNAG
jgi:hypothetical protein